MHSDGYPMKHHDDFTQKSYSLVLFRSKCNLILNRKNGCNSTMQKGSWPDIWTIVSATLYFTNTGYKWKQPLLIFGEATPFFLCQFSTYSNKVTRYNPRLTRKHNNESPWKPTCCHLCHHTNSLDYRDAVLGIYVICLHIFYKVASVALEQS